MPDAHHQVYDDRDIDQQNDDLRCCQMPADFVDLQRYQSSGGDDREVFCPALPQQQARTLGKKEAGVDEGANAESLELILVDIKETGQKSVHEPVVGIDAKDIYPVRDGFGNILMQQLERANTNCKQQHPFDELEGSDEQEHGRALSTRGGLRRGLQLGHLLIR